VRRSLAAWPAVSPCGPSPPVWDVPRPPSRNGGRGRYRGVQAHRVAQRRARRPKPCKLAVCPALATLVGHKLVARWSPEQIAGWLARTYVDDPGMRVSHETIYRTLFVQSRGGLAP
jgi:IS30 family transposase